MVMEMDEKSRYIEGRLKGLYELVAILKETIDSSENVSSPVLLRSIVTHISKEVESILNEFSDEEHPLLDEATDAHKDLKKALASRKPPTMPEMKKQVDAADELMKNLMAFKQQQGSDEEESEPAQDK